MVGVDITLQQLTELVQGVKIAETGFAFLSQQSGNVLTVNETGEALLGIQPGECHGCGRDRAGPQPVQEQVRGNRQSQDAGRRRRPPSPM